MASGTCEVAVFGRGECTCGRGLGGHQMAITAGTLKALREYAGPLPAQIDIDLLFESYKRAWDKFFKDSMAIPERYLNGAPEFNQHGFAMCFPAVGQMPESDESYEASAALLAVRDKEKI
jgi:hypothetical protein